MIFHSLHTSIAKPAQFTFPFCYEPHPLCLQAASEVQKRIADDGILRADADRGKMFGVLVVEKPNGDMGYLAAYSGLLAGRNDWEFFVPPVYDALKPHGYFKKHEREISKLNERIAKMENDAELKNRREDLERLKRGLEQEIADFQQEMKTAKKRRDELRASADFMDDWTLIAESQFMKAELKRMKRTSAGLIELEKSAIADREKEINDLKMQRKQQSDALQQWLFMQFDMLNARGERRNLCDIFASTVHKTPPSGAGECCAPKLLQYAYLHHLHPVCMAEFWWGESPKTEIRRHLNYYPACQGKCKPILSHMLQGLDVEDNPLETPDGQALDIVYDDAWLAVVNKPAGMLSVPGRSSRPSVLSFVRRMYPDADGPIVVHRLDMATSGLLIVAKTKDVHKKLQMQFRNHEVSKRYIAVVDGAVTPKHGVISLPLSADYLDRPRQIVDAEHGKTAVTEYQVLKERNGSTLISLFPHTGRTHQLRVHCAHPDGLNAPIHGDMLYGNRSERLCLHAEEITFVHPVTGKKMRIEVKIQHPLFDFEGDE